MKCPRCGGQGQLLEVREGTMLALIQLTDGTFRIDTALPSARNVTSLICLSCTRPAADYEVIWVLSKMAAQASAVIS